MSLSFQEVGVKQFQVGQKRKQREEQEGEWRQQEEGFRREIDAGDPHQTSESKRQTMRAELQERHVESMDELHATHQSVLDNPAVLAVFCAALKEEEGKRVAQERREMERRMAAHEERDGGSCVSASVALKQSDTLEGANEGGDGGLEEDLLQPALLASIQDGKRRRTPSQRQCQADESAAIQKSKKGPHTSRRQAQRGEQDDVDGGGTGVWGQEPLESLPNGQRTKKPSCPHGKER